MCSGAPTKSRVLYTNAQVATRGRDCYHGMPHHGPEAMQLPDDVDFKNPKVEARIMAHLKLDDSALRRLVEKAQAVSGRISIVHVTS